MANLSHIKKYLKEKKIPYKLISLRSSPPEADAGLKVIDLGAVVFTAEEAKKSGVEEGEIVKTLIVRCNRPPAQRASGPEGFIALAVRGQDRVDFKKVRRLFGPSTSLRINCELAKPEEVLKVVGVPVGAVCPILIGLPLYIDRQVMNLMRVNMGSGDLKFGLEMELEDLLKAVEDYKVANLVHT